MGPTLLWDDVFIGSALRPPLQKWWQPSGADIHATGDKSSKTTHNTALHDIFKFVFTTGFTPQPGQHRAPLQRTHIFVINTEADSCTRT
mmetsp:Transcript_31315/g.83310  ORF Transcript_31315/g.83310 Transcript_31315/m.83310 type:complete len:89 (+) Transcript_31315:1-267(+)